MKLGVNIDHIASVRRLRDGDFPDPAMAAVICEKSGADSVVAHLREDRRHIRETDLLRIKKIIRGKLNMEMSVAPDIVAFCLKLKPDQATLVPEKRRELTTEGGLDVAGNLARIRTISERLENRGIAVSLFIDPDRRQIDAARAAGITRIELHTGEYADAKGKQRQHRLAQLQQAVQYAGKLGFHVYAGHGLDYANVAAVTRIPGVEELNIGYSIVSRALFTGLENAVREMKKLIS